MCTHRHDTICLSSFTELLGWKLFLKIEVIGGLNQVFSFCYVTNSGHWSKEPAMASEYANFKNINHLECGSYPYGRVNSRTVSWCNCFQQHTRKVYMLQRALSAVAFLHLKKSFEVERPEGNVSVRRSKLIIMEAAWLSHYGEHFILSALKEKCDIKECKFVPVLNWLSTTPWRLMGRHIYLTSTLVGGEWSPSRSSRFIPGEAAAVTYSIRVCVAPRTSLDTMEKENSCPHRDSNSTARSSCS
jgi:hypothetical protein